MKKLKEHKFLIGVIFISLIYFILTSVQHPIFIYNAGYDDYYMVYSALSILNLDWLGTFTEVTLTKGIGAPLFMAVANIFGLTLMQAQYLLYIGAVVLFVHVLKKVIKNDWVRLLIFTFMLFNPAMYQVEMLRVYRDSFNSSMLLLLISFALGIFFNYKEKKRKILPYMIGFSIASTIMAITREEAIWIAPFVLGSSIITCLFIIFDKECKLVDRIKKILLYLIPIFVYVATILMICLLNKIAYGEFIRIEQNSKPFKNLMKAISSVDVEEPNIRVPVKKEAMEKLYEVSPAFSEYKEYFESTDGKNFASAGVVEDEIEDGWFFWAILSGASRNGHGQNLKTLNDYYRKITDEVNKSFEEGKLKKEDNPASIFDKDNFNELLNNIKNTFEFQVSGERFGLRAGQDTFFKENPDFPEVREDMFEEVTGNSSTNSLTYNYRIDNIKITILEKIANIYRKISKPLFMIALVIYALIILRFFLIKPRFENYKELIILTSLILLHFIRIIVIAYTETAKFPAISVMYLSSTYSLQFAFEILSLVFGIKEIIKLIRKK